MSLLHYANITNHRPDILRDRVKFGLREFQDFLRNQKEYLESESALQILKWERTETVTEATAKGVWVHLEEYAKCSSSYDAVLKDFLDDTVKSVYELDLEQNLVLASFQKGSEIEVLDRDIDNERMLLSRLPKWSGLCIRPNVYQIQSQLKAIRKLMEEPHAAHRPLLRLFESADHAVWKTKDMFSPEKVKGVYKILTDDSRDGSQEQKQFVVTALSTPDFAILEGPPGSGKTTVICELIQTIVNQNLRVLLCASTHVAVDNVLERLMDPTHEWRHEIVPIRIGDSSNVSELAKPYQLANFMKTERERLKKRLREIEKKSDAQESLQNMLDARETNLLERLVLDSANLICGTTLGILQHPDIKGAQYGQPQFDFLIIDEASKTTFQEFLVPALLAKRWILVGDPMQLSPYVDDEALAVNVKSCQLNQHARNAAIDVFLAKQRDSRQRFTLAAVPTEAARKLYLEQAASKQVICIDADSVSGESLAHGEIVVGSQEAIQKYIDYLPLDISNLRGLDDGFESLQRKNTFWCAEKNISRNVPTWEAEVSWRLARLYDHRYNEIRENGGTRRTASQRLQDDIANLMPTGEEGKFTFNRINQVRRVALPSILETIQRGFERKPGQKAGSAITDGLPPNILADRHVKLSYQHRMHPDIAEFSHKNIYQESALHSAKGMTDRREWSYPGFQASRAVWLQVKGNKNPMNANQEEAKRIIQELQKFEQWAKSNSNSSKPWEVAVLTFYRGQEREIRSHLRKWTKQFGSVRYFNLGSRGSYHVKIQLCTVDRFQGHEADFVMLSFANDHPTSFLESPNRINVAITRARYQLVVFGNRKAMQKSNSILGDLANQMAWEQKL